MCWDAVRKYGGCFVEDGEKVRAVHEAYCQNFLALMGRPILSSPIPDQWSSPVSKTSSHRW